MIVIAVAVVVLHWVTGHQYGFHRDELQTLDDARHLTWGFVAYPPITPFFGRLSLMIFGTSLAGFRFFAAVAAAVSLVLTGLMARELGGSRGAQLLAIAAGLAAAIGAAVMMQYVAFDYLWWVLTAFFCIRLLRTDDPRWWLAIGCGIGLGMETKYTMGVFAIGIVAGVLFTGARRYLRSKWLWLGVAISVLLFLPNVVWQAQHQFVSLDFLKHIHERDVRIGRTKDFLPDQIKLTLLATPLWLAGLWFYFFSREGKRFRLLGWMYLVPLAVFIVTKGRGYYLLAAYPMLYAAGCVLLERRLPARKPAWSKAGWTIAWAALLADAVFIAAITLPIAPVGSRWFQFSSSENGDLNEMIGWPELVSEVARIRNTQPNAKEVGVLAANYGEAGAINLYGPQYGLPPAIMGINSFWYRSYPDPQPQTMVVLGFSQTFRDRRFTSCELEGHTPRINSVHNEETDDHPDIYVCHGLKLAWPEFWKDFHYYG